MFRRGCRFTAPRTRNADGMGCKSPNQLVTSALARLRTKPSQRAKCKGICTRRVSSKYKDPLGNADQLPLLAQRESRKTSRTLPPQSYVDNLQKHPAGPKPRPRLFPLGSGAVSRFCANIKYLTGKNRCVSIAQRRSDPLQSVKRLHPTSLPFHLSCFLRTHSECLDSTHF